MDVRPVDAILERPQNVACPERTSGRPGSVRATPNASIYLDVRGARENLGGGAAIQIGVGGTVDMILVVDLRRQLRAARLLDFRLT